MVRSRSSKRNLGCCSTLPVCVWRMHLFLLVQSILSSKKINFWKKKKPVNWRSSKNNSRITSSYVPQRLKVPFMWIGCSRTEPNNSPFFQKAENARLNLLLLWKKESVWKLQNGFYHFLKQTVEYKHSSSVNDPKSMLALTQVQLWAFVFFSKLQLVSIFVSFSCFYFFLIISFFARSSGFERKTRIENHCPMSAAFPVQEFGWFKPIIE